MQINANVHPIAAARARDLLGVTAELAKKPNKAGDTYTGQNFIPLAAMVPANGDITKRIEGGSYNFSSATKALGWPEDTNTWAHLIASTHSNPTSNFSLQIAGGFFENDRFYVRKTNGNGAQPWRQLWHDGNFNLGNAVFAPAYPTLQAAFDAVPDGGILYLGAKRWVITQALTIANKSFRIQGAGVGVSVINYRGTDGYGIRISQDSYYRRFSLAGFTLTTNQDRTGVAIDVLRPEGVSSVEYGPNFDDIEICGEDQAGPHAWGIGMHLSYCWNAVLNRCTFQGRNGYFSGVGLFLDGQSTPVQMYACRGFYLDTFVKGIEGPKNFEGFIAHDCQVVACRHGYWLINGGNFPLVQIHGGHINVSGYAVRVSGRPQGSIKNVCIYHWYGATVPGGASPNDENWCGVSVEQGADDFSVTGCHFYGYRSLSASGAITGIQWQGTADGQISDNAFISLKVAVSAIDSPVMVTNNRARDCLSFMSNVPQGSLVKDNLRMSAPVNGSYRYPENVPA